MKWITSSDKLIWKCTKDSLPEGELQYEYVLTYNFESDDLKFLYYLKDENQWHTGTGSSYEPDDIHYWVEIPTLPDYEQHFNDFCMPNLNSSCTNDNCCKVNNYEMD